jgi:hypothetical protein
VIQKQSLLAYLLIVISFIVSGCSSTFPNQSPIGKTFPQVSGESLEQKKVTFPDDISGKPVVLLLGYEQNSQFDIDRWLIGLDMTQTQVEFYELPTIQGMIPRFFKSQIDSGMRKGIPKELWKGVVTIYKDGEKLQAFTGNTNPNNARVILLDPKGKIIFFYDDGFSVNALNKLRSTLNLVVAD